MSAAATLVQIGPQPVDTTQNEIVAKFKIALSGNYSPASVNGDVLNLINALIPSGRTPTKVIISEEPPAGTAPTGYHFLYAPGGDLSSGKLVVLVGTAGADAQITQNAAYPGALTGTTYIYALAFIPSY